MAFIRTSAPFNLKLYCTHSLSPSTQSGLQHDFSLAAFPRHPSVLLSISPRKDLYGLRPEEVLMKLSRERDRESEHDVNHENGFLVADDLTERDGDGVWYIAGWLHRDDFWDEMLSPEAQSQVAYNEEGDSNFAQKLRIFMHYAPILYVNLEIANTSIPEQYAVPYSPNSPLNLVPSDGGLDWRVQSPPTAYIIAHPSAYEISTNSGTGNRIKRLGAPKKENDEAKVCRLKSEWADRLRVVADWRSGWVWEGNCKDKVEQQLAEEAGLFQPGEEMKVKEGVMCFAQPWKWEPPPVESEKRTEGWKSKYVAV